MFNRSSYNFRNIHRKALFKYVAGLMACNVQKLRYSYFSVNLAKILRTAFFRTLLVTVSVKGSLKDVFQGSTKKC